MHNPIDPQKPWNDSVVQNCARSYLKKVIEPAWVREHATSPSHKKCKSPYVDEWGRELCDAIHGVTIGVDGNWDNPTHYLFSIYGADLRAFMRSNCNINV
jgi:hypothetical protein